MIVQREEEIKRFLPQDYWTVRADFGDYFGDWRGKEGNRIFDYPRVEELLIEASLGRTGHQNILNPYIESSTLLGVLLPVEKDSF